MIGHYKREIDIAFCQETACRNRVAVAHHHRTLCPHVADVKLAAMEFSSCLDPIDDHACHFGQSALGEFLHHVFHVGKTSRGITGIEFAQSADKDKLVAVVAQGESAGRYFGVALHLVKAVGLEGGVGGSIERVFKMDTDAGILLVIGVRQQYCPLAFGIIRLQLVQELGRPCFVVAS